MDREGLQDTQTKAEQKRHQSLDQLTQRRRTVQTKLDRGHEDYLDGKISDAFWTRKSQEWKSELGMIEAEICRLSRPAPAYAVTGQKISELAKNAYFLYSW